MIGMYATEHEAYVACTNWRYATQPHTNKCEGSGLGGAYWDTSKYSYTYTGKWYPDSQQLGTAVWLFPKATAVAGVDYRTCPVDADEDGVDNSVDRCPGQAGNAEDGCAHAELDLGLDPLAMSVCPLKGDPVSLYSGNHMESEEDVRFASPFTKGLVFKRLI
jgi:hypothetical protein